MMLFRRCAIAAVAALTVLAPVLVLSPAASAQVSVTYTVDTEADVAGGACDDIIEEDCSLRSAIQLANANAGPDEIAVPAGTYGLTIAGAGEDEAATGDLDITDDVVITGVGADAVLIEGLDTTPVVLEDVESLAVDPTVENDRVFDVVGAAATIDGVEITGGVADDETDDKGGAIQVRGEGGALTSSDVVLAGNAASLAGGGIEVTGPATAILGSVTFEDNMAGVNGGGLHITGAGVVNADPVTVDGNSAGAEGGGFWNSSTGTLTVTGVFGANTASGDDSDQGGGNLFNDGGTLTVADSTVADGAATGAAGSGGNIFNNAGILTIASSEIANGSAPRAGGGIETFDGTVSLTDTDFYGNVAGGETPAPGNGGALHVSGSASVDVIGGVVGEADPDLFETTRGNVAAAEGGGFWNGGGTMTITGTTFENNVAAGDDSSNGGGALFQNPGGTLDVDGVEILSNRATGAAGSGGGIFVDQGTLDLTNSTLSDNGAARAGGGIEVRNLVEPPVEAQAALAALSTVDITDTDLLANDAGVSPGNGGALHISGAGDATITGGTVADNTAVEGGGLWNNTGTLTVDGTAFSGNQATGAEAAQGGGAIFNQGGTLSVTGASFDENDATGAAPGGSGGAILDEFGTTSVADSTFDANTAVRAGGAIEGFSSEPISTLTIMASDFEANTAGINGGAIHHTGNGDSTIVGGFFTANIAASEGGAFWNGGGVAELTGVFFSGNEANGDETSNGGGGVFVLDGEVTVIDSGFVSNTVNGEGGRGGGALVVAGSLDVSGSLFALNVANAGGGIDMQGAETTTLVDTTRFGQNFASINGGGIHTSGGTLDVTDSSFDSNIAVNEGGGIWPAGPTVIEGTTLTENAAAAEGGGLFVQADTTSIFNSTVSGNAASADGGGVYVNDTATASIEHVTVTDNDGGEGTGGVATGNDGEAILVASIVDANVGVQCNNVTSDGDNVFGDDTCDDGADDVIDSAELGPLADNGGPTLTHLPGFGSPAAGLVGECGPAVDQRDVERPETDCTAGAVEGADPDAPFVVKELVPLTVNGTYVTTTGDYNNDGLDDVFFQKSGSAADYVLLSDGDGTFTSVPVVVNGTYEPFSGDFDGDGRDEIVLYAPGSGGDYIMKFTGSRAAFTTTPVTLNGTYRPFTGDFDGDGDDDIVYYAPGAAPDYIHEATGQTSFRSTPVSIGGTYQTATGDVSGDGIDDISFFNINGPDYTWEMTSVNTFVSRVVSPNLTGSYLSVGGDFNGDALLDLYHYNPGSLPERFVDFSTPTSYDVVPFGNAGAAQVILEGDYDGNGVSDLLFYQPGSGSDTVALLGT